MKAPQATPRGRPRARNHPAVRDFLGASQHQRHYEYGGVLRKP